MTQQERKEFCKCLRNLYAIRTNLKARNIPSEETTLYLITQLENLSEHVTSFEEREKFGKKKGRKEINTKHMTTRYNERVLVLSRQLPDRKIKRRGPKPIKKEALVEGLLFWLETGCPWRCVPHSATVRRYFFEVQRRGLLFKLIKHALPRKHRPPQAIIDATDIKTWKGAPWTRYSGKYHNYCIKLTLSVTPQKRLLDYSLDYGSTHDSKILNKMLSKWENLPYELFLDKGDESYSRRRNLQNNNCQVRMEQKNYPNNRKRGPRFRFSKSHSTMRLRIERYFAHLKKFALFKGFRFRKIATLKLALWCALFLVFVA